MLAVVFAHTWCTIDAPKRIADSKFSLARAWSGLTAEPAWLRGSQGQERPNYALQCGPVIPDARTFGTTTASTVTPQSNRQYISLV